MEKLDKNDFLIFPSLNIFLRFLLSSIIISIAYYLQISGNFFQVVLGFIFLLFFIILNWIKKVEIDKGFVSDSKKKWENTTMEEFRAALKKVKKIDSFGSKKGSGYSFFFIGIIIFIIIESNGAPAIISFLILDAIAILGVIIASGNRYIWSPEGLKQKLSILLNIYNIVMKNYKDIYNVLPQFLIEEKEKKYVPHDAKLMLSPKENVKDFLGIQFSVSINNVQSKQYPYLYSVIIAKKDFRLLTKFEKIRSLEGIRDLEGFLIFEPKSQSDGIEIIVIRKNTALNKGYYTNKKDQKRIINSTIKISNEILKL